MHTGRPIHSEPAGNGRSALAALRWKLHRTVVRWWQLPAAITLFPSCPCWMSPRRGNDQKPQLKFRGGIPWPRMSLSIASLGESFVAE